MREGKVVVELTLFDRLDHEQRKELGHYKDTVNIVKDFNFDHVTLEPINEPDPSFDVYDGDELIENQDCNIAHHINRYIQDLNLISSMGAYGASCEKYHKLLKPNESSNQVKSHHRKWHKDHIAKDVIKTKPLNFNEYFDRGNLGLARTQEIMSEAFDAGAAAVCNYGYGFEEFTGEGRADPWDYMTMLEFIEGLLEEWNG